MTKLVAGAQISLVSSCHHSLHYHTEQTHALSPKFLQLTSPGEQRSDDYIRPTFTPPRHAGFQIITHTNMHTQSHHRWTQIILIVTVQRNIYMACTLQNYTISMRYTCYFSKDASGFKAKKPDCTSS